MHWRKFTSFLLNTQFFLNFSLFPLFPLFLPKKTKTATKKTNRSVATNLLSGICVFTGQRAWGKSFRYSGDVFTSKQSGKSFQSVKCFEKYIRKSYESSYVRLSFVEDCAKGRPNSSDNINWKLNRIRRRGHLKTSSVSYVSVLCKRSGFLSLNCTYSLLRTRTYKLILVIYGHSQQTTYATALYYFLLVIKKLALSRIQL